MSKSPDLKNAVYRRIVSISLNSGVPMRLIERIGWSVDEFRRCQINLRNSAQVDLNVAKDALGFALDCFTQCNVSLSKKEAHLCNSFWHPMLLKFFLGSRLKLQFEWDLKDLLPEGDQRSVDVVVLAEFVPGEPIPILLVEAGLEEAPPGSIHKDYSKENSALSLCCRELAGQFEALGKDLKDARCYGILVGGLGAQFYVACPEIKHINGRNELAINIEALPHWYTHFSRGLAWDANCGANCCSGELENSFESVIEPSRPFSHLLTEPIAPPSTVEFKKKRKKQSAPYDDEDIESVEDTGRQPNPDSIKATYYFLNGLREWAETQLAPATATSNHPSTSAGPPISVLRSTTSGTVSRASSGTNQESPFKNRPASVLSEPPRDMNMTRIHPPSGERSFSIKKSFNEIEAYLFKTLPAICQTCFPYLIALEVDEANQNITYEFERMIPLVTTMPPQGDLTLDSRWIACTSIRSLQDAFEFLLGASVGLYHLHKFGYVHSDVSPNNILYSWVHQCWKLTDFNHAMKLEDSLKTCRNAGTRGTVAPESSMSGIFTRQSDIYALGMTALKLIAPYLEKMSFDAPEHQKCKNLYFRLLRLMTRMNFAARPAPEFIIQLTVMALSCFDVPYASYRIIKVALGILEETGLSYESGGIDDCVALITAIEASLEASATAVSGQEKEKIEASVDEKSAMKDIDA